MSEPVKPTVWETEKISGPKKFRHVLTFENDDPCFGAEFAERFVRAAPEPAPGDRERAERVWKWLKYT